MSEARAKWDAKYRAGSHPASEPVPLLAEVLARALPGRALDVACGRGRHAIALARRGYAVDAIDISPVGLASARERAGELTIRWTEADLGETALETAAYQVIVWVHFTDEVLVPRVLEALAPGGVLVFCARPRVLCRYGPPPGVVARWFRPLRTLVHRESEERIEYAGRR
ncbi:MAG: class I SAM-dependent methyltransferase [Planctomycetota bacterium]|jgi:SAM-dependent methyltransferase